MRNGDLEEMDKAAGEAEIELSHMPDEIIAPVCNWFFRYYMRAGHKRLGRILAANGKRLAGRK